MATERANAASSAGAAVRRLPWFALVVVFAALMVLLAGCGGINAQTVGEDDLHFFVHGRNLTGPEAGMEAEVLGL